MFNINTIQQFQEKSSPEGCVLSEIKHSNKKPRTLIGFSYDLSIKKNSPYLSGEL